jgi:hypothetical protein
VELDWTLGVHSRHGPTRPVRLDIARTPALALTGAPSTGRVWLLDFYGTRAPFENLARCAPDWFHKPYRIECLRLGDRAGEDAEGRAQRTLGDDGEDAGFLPHGVDVRPVVVRRDEGAVGDGF